MKVKSEKGSASSVLLVFCIILILALVAGIVFVALNRDMVDNGSWGSWGGKSATSVFDETGKAEGKLHIGDYVNYDEGEGNECIIEVGGSSNGLKIKTSGSQKWRVLDVKDGKVALVCDDSIKIPEIKNGHFLEGNLDTICSIYGHGVGAESARSIAMTDIVGNDENAVADALGKRAYELFSIDNPKYDVLFRNGNRECKEYMIAKVGVATKFIGPSANTLDARIGDSENDVIAILPLVTLKSDVVFTGVDENGVWQIKGSNKVKPEEETYIDIASKDDLIKLSNGQNSVRANYRLINDIDLSGEQNFTPIEDFGGIFDGNGHKITGLKLNVNKAGNYGLFATTLNATIKNLNIEQCNITVNAIIANKEKICVGSLIGDGQYTNVQNCNANGTINIAIIDGEYEDGTVGAGIMFGNFEDGYIFNSTASGKINDTETKSTSYLGGFAYHIERCDIENCNTNVDISTDYCCSGFAHYTESCLIYRCSSKGNLKTTKGSAYGFCSNLNFNSSLIQSYAKCNMTMNVGSGFVGYGPTAFYAAEIVDCYSCGKINIYDTNSPVDLTDMVEGQLTPTRTCYELFNITAGDKNLEVRAVYNKEGDGTVIEGNFDKSQFNEFDFDNIWKWNDQESRPELSFEE